MHAKKMKGLNMNKNKHISIRIDADVLRKLHYVSEYEGRSASGQIMYMINSCIRDFEQAHGAIELPEETE